MKVRSETAAVFGLLVSTLFFLSGTPDARAQSTPAVEVVWSATRADFAGQMMDIDRFDNVYSVGDTVVGGVVLTRKFSADGILLWERTYRPESAVKATWVAADPGGAYVVGYKFTGANPPYPIGYFVLRYDADGNLLWSDISDGSAAQAVRAVTDHAGNAYVTGDLYVAGNFTIGIVKYSPAGGRQWVCPVVNPNGNAFPGTPLPTGLYVSDNGSWIAASGTSAYLYYVLSCDESGFKRWQAFRDQPTYAAAVAVNNQGEVYFGNGVASAAGMQLAKYSATGVLQWTNAFSPGSYIHRLALDSLGNVIAIGPGYNGLYADWVTMKVAPTGARLWSSTFSALTGNDEIPWFVALDFLDNIYVTGVGGPAQTGTSFMRMVTLKYTAGGVPVWTVDTVVGGRGNSVRVGSDASTLFVQGYGEMYTARYRQTGLVDAPPAPTTPPPVASPPAPPPPQPAPAPIATPLAPASLSASALSSRRIQLRWTNKSSAQTAISIERCNAPCTNFTEIARVAGNATSFINSALASRTSYSYRARAYNGTAGSPYSTSVTAKTTR